MISKKQLIVTSGQMEPEENVTFFTSSFIITFLLICSSPVLNSDVFWIQATFLNFRTKNGTHWKTQRCYRHPNLQWQCLTLQTVVWNRLDVFHTINTLLFTLNGSSAFQSKSSYRYRNKRTFKSHFYSKCAMFWIKYPLWPVSYCCNITD